MEGSGGGGVRKLEISVAKWTSPGFVLTTNEVGIRAATSGSHGDVAGVCALSYGLYRYFAVLLRLSTSGET